jgi:hypothetical protein
MAAIEVESGMARTAPWRNTLMLPENAEGLAL